MIVIPYIPERVTLARELAGMTRTELAAKIEVTPHTITSLESMPGTRISAAQIRRLALVLGVPPAYFTTKLKTPWLNMDRILSTQPLSDRAILKRQTRARAWHVSELAAHMREDWHGPSPSIFLEDHLALDGLMPAAKASALRARWGLGDGAMPKLAWSMENRGITILPMPDATASVAAYHAGQPTAWVHWQDRCPLEVQTQLATMLGYLLDDEHEEMLPFASEQRARLFAKVLLMPKSSFPSRDFIPRSAKRPTPTHIWEEAQRWSVPYAWVLRRAQDLGAINHHDVKRLHDAPVPTLRADTIDGIGSPTVFAHMLQHAASTDLDALAAKVGLYPHMLTDLIPTPLAQGATR